MITAFFSKSSQAIGLILQLGFPYGSAGKESTCDERDLSLIPGLGRSEKGTATHFSILAQIIPWTV